VVAENCPKPAEGPLGFEASAGACEEKVGIAGVIEGCALDCGVEAETLGFGVELAAFA
jgi:hypothetical protein